MSPRGQAPSVRVTEVHGPVVPPASVSLETLTMVFFSFSVHVCKQTEGGGASLGLTEESGFHFPGLPHQHREETWPGRREEEQKGGSKERESSTEEEDGRTDALSHVL